MGCCSTKPHIHQPVQGKPDGTNAVNQTGQDGVNAPQRPTYEPSISLRKLDGKAQTMGEIGNIQGLLPADGISGGSQGRSRGDSHPNQENIKESYQSGAKQCTEESKEESANKPKKKPQVFFDLTPHAAVKHKHQIYHVSHSTTPPVSKPYSTLVEWQSLISKHQQFTEEEMVSKLLSLRNRNWILEQIKLLNEQNSQSPSSLDSLLISRRILQIREHFNWLAWAIAQFYFFFNGSNQHYAQFQQTAVINNLPQSAQTNSESRDTTNVSMNSSSLNNAQRILLPKVGSRAWTDGFDFKGLFVRVIPYEDAQYIRNEMRALKYCQVELLELKSIAASNNAAQNVHATLMQFSGASLHQEVLLPLISGVSCGGFYLYVTPIIFIPKSSVIENRLEKEFIHVREMLFRGSSNSVPQALNLSPSPQPPEHYDINNNCNSSPASQGSLNQREQEETVTTDSMFKYMPILKRITTRNLIPIYDYEQYPASTQISAVDVANNKNAVIEPPMFYIMLNLYDILPRVSTDVSPGITMMRIPCSTNEEITFHRLQKTPENGYSLEAKQLRRFIQTGHLLINNFVPGGTSTFFKQYKNATIAVGDLKDPDESDVDLQADEYQNFLGAIDYEHIPEGGETDEARLISELYQKITFTKHGQEFLLVSRKQGTTAINVLQTQTHPSTAPQIPQTIPLQHLNMLNENRRAMVLLSSREIQLMQHGPNAQTQEMVSISHKSQTQTQEEHTPLKAMHLMPMEEHIGIVDQTGDYPAQQTVQKSRISPNIKQGLFFRQDGGASGMVGGLFDVYQQNDHHTVFSNKVFGNSVITLQNYKKDFKLQYSLNNHSFSGSIDSMFSASIDHVVQVLEKSDKYYNQQSLKELLHRKGLNTRFSWIILVKLRYNALRELLMMDILMRVMRKIVNEEVKLKSITVITSSDGNQSEEYYQASGSVDTFREMLTFYANTLLKRKMHKYRQVFEETLLGLFLSRISVLGLAHSMNLKKEEFYYLESKDILEDIIEAPSKNPSLFINAISNYFHLEFKPDFLRILRQDKFLYLGKSQPVSKSDLKPSRVHIVSYFSLREEAYFILARQISNNHQMMLQKEESSRQNQGLIATSMNLGPQNMSKSIIGGVGKMPTKIKTKTDKDRLPKASARRQPHNIQSASIVSSARGKPDKETQQNDIGSFSMVLSRNNSSLIESDAQLNHSRDDNQHSNVDLLMAGSAAQQLRKEKQPSNNTTCGNQQTQTKRSQNPKTQVIQDFRPPKDSLSTIRQYQNMEAIINESPQFAQNFGLGKPDECTVKLHTSQLSQMLDFSKFSKRNNFKPTQNCEIVLPSTLYKFKTFFSSNPMYYFDDASKTYVGDTYTILRPQYEMPSLDVVDEWTIVMESLLKDVYTVNGSEQVLLEALVYQALLIYFFNSSETDELFKVLTKIRDALFTVTYCSPETLVVIQILTGMYFEDKRDQLPVEAEKSYLAGLTCIFQLYGDPRGRGNLTMPYSLYLSWKLSLLAIAEDKKLHDSEFAEELFDATLKCLINHKLSYKEQQLTNFQNANMMGNKIPNQGAAASNSSLPTEVMGTPGQPLEKSKFQIEQELLELQRLRFDIKKYRNKPFNITYASGMYKAGGGGASGGLPLVPTNNPSASGSRKKISAQFPQQAAMNVYVSVNHHYNNNKELKGSALKDNRASTEMFLMSQEFYKSRSQINSIGGIKNTRIRIGGMEGIGERTEADEDLNHNAYDLEPSEIDLEIEDENKNYFIDENLKNTEWQIGTCPFQHWSLYKQQIMQILQAHNLTRNNPAQQLYQKQIYREMLSKFLQKDLFYQWLVRYNPIMYQSGTQWSNQAIREIIFCQNQQMVSSSGSSAVMSHHNMSHHSMSSNMGMSLGGGSNAPTSAKEKRNMHLGSYSQILGKESGGISKQDMHGILFTMGTDAYGQLGLEAITNKEKEAQSISLKILYPRMVLALRDEMIREVCCGHCHTMVINIHGQVFGWGLNESGQLGLGPDAPPAVRKPAFNPYLQNVSKLSAGNEHSLAITKSGDLYIWGGGGLTGLGDTNIVSIPTKMDFFQNQGIKIQQAICGGLHTVVLSKEGEVFTWGATEGGQLGLPQSMIAELNQGKEQPVLTPQKIPKFEGIPMIQVACGEAHSIAMTKEGNRLFGWGMSNYGQLGLGFSSDSFEPGVGMEKSKVHEPMEITGLKNTEHRVTKIICGATFSLFQTDKGELFGCGMNDLGQLGLDTYMEELLQLGSGGGANGLDKVKRGKHHTSDVTVPTKVICFQGIALHNIACGENHALAVSGDDRNMLWAWGMYRQGQLGLGEVTMKMNPRPVQTLCSSSIQKIACGSMHSLVLIGDPQQISTLSSQYYAGSNNFDVIANHWQCDFRGLMMQQPGGILSGTPGSRFIDKECDDLLLQKELNNAHPLSQFWTVNSNQQPNTGVHQSLILNHERGSILSKGQENVVVKRDDDLSGEDHEGKIKNPK